MNFIMAMAENAIWGAERAPLVVLVFLMIATWGWE
jgi:hypothetical protein